MRFWLSYAFVPAVQVAKCRAGVVPVWSGAVVSSGEDLENGDQDESTCQYRDGPGGDF
jgi:hypothetical protein